MVWASEPQDHPAGSDVDKRYEELLYKYHDLVVRRELVFTTLIGLERSQKRVETLIEVANRAEKFNYQPCDTKTEEECNNDFNRECNADREWYHATVLELREERRRYVGTVFGV